MIRKSPKFCAECGARGKQFQTMHVPRSDRPANSRRVTQCYVRRNYRCACGSSWSTVEVDTRELDG